MLTCSDDETACDTSPSFSNISTNQVSYTSLNISGSITPSECDSNVISQGVVYSTSELPTQSNNSIVFSNNSYTETITGLSLSTTYFFRPFFVNQDGVFYGNQASVTTLSSSISFSNIEHSPSITSVFITADYDFDEGQGVSISSKGVILNGVQYEDSESTNGIISVNIEGLESNTNYSYSMFVVNEFGTTESSSSSFQTDNSSSVVSNLTISNIDFTSVDLAATYENLYSGDDITTDKGIVISLNENFENQVEYSSSSDANIIEVSLTALETNTVYYVKGYVENEYGINYGQETSFETNDAGYSFNSINITGIDFETADSSVTFNQVEGVFTPPTSKGFRVSQNENFSGYTDYNDNNNIENGTSINWSFEGLTISTVYYVKAFVTNEYGTFFSDEVATFQTLSIDYVASYVVNAVGYDYTQIDVDYNQSSGSIVEVLEKGIEIYQTPSYNVVDANSPDGSMSLTMSNLTHNSNYTFVGYVTTEYGKYYFEGVVEINTLDATPSFSSSTSDVSFDSVNILTTFGYAAETTNSLVRIVLSNNDNQQYIELDNNEISQESAVDNLTTNTNYLYYLEVLNQYGTFSSPTYQFATFNDEPNIDFSYELTGENQITLTGSITPANGDESINSIYIQYKHHEENNYNTINLNSSNYSISEVLNDLVQGPNYNFKLVVINGYNSFEENLYYNIPVTYALDDLMFGGVIAYIDDSGHHGYVMSELQYVATLQWSDDKNASDELVYLNGLGSSPLYPDGEVNTQIIVDFHSGISASAPAAEYCYNLNINGYDDWFLGSNQQYQLSQGNMWNPFGIANGAPHNTVWTSNTYQANPPTIFNKAMLSSYNGNPSIWNPKDNFYSVWPMRKF